MKTKHMGDFRGIWGDSSGILRVITHKCTTEQGLPVYIKGGFPQTSMGNYPPVRRGNKSSRS